MNKEIKSVTLSSTYLTVNTSSSTEYSLSVTFEPSDYPNQDGEWVYESDKIDVKKIEGNTITFIGNESFDHAVVSQIAFVPHDDVTKLTKCVMWVSPGSSKFSVLPESQEVFVNSEMEFQVAYDKFRGDPVCYFDKEYIMELPNSSSKVKSFKALKPTDSNGTNIVFVYMGKTYFTKCIIKPPLQLTNIFLDPQTKTSPKDTDYYIVLRTDPQTSIPDGKWVIEEQDKEYIDLIAGTTTNIAHIKVKDTLELPGNVFRSFTVRYIGGGYDLVHTCTPVIQNPQYASFTPESVGATVNEPVGLDISFSPEGSYITPVPILTESLWDYDSSKLKLVRGHTSASHVEFIPLQTSSQPYIVSYKGVLDAFGNNPSAKIFTTPYPLSALSFDKQQVNMKVTGLLKDYPFNPNKFTLEVNYTPVQAEHKGHWVVSHPDKIKMIQSSPEQATFIITEYCSSSDGVSVSFVSDNDQSIKAICPVVTSSTPITSITCDDGMHDVYSDGIFKVAIDFYPENSAFGVNMPKDKQGTPGNMSVNPDYSWLPVLVDVSVDSVKSNRVIYTFKNVDYDFAKIDPPNYFFLYFQAKVYPDDPYRDRDAPFCKWKMNYK